MAKKKYLITGGLGFIGSALANKLDGHVTVLSRSDERKDRLQRKDVKILIKDLNVNFGLRQKAVGVTGSIYRLLDNIHQIKEAIDFIIVDNKKDKTGGRDQKVNN